jgi:hypothetical protein
MKKTKLLLSSVLAAGMLAVGAAPQNASALQFSYTASINVQNLSTSNASIVITFYNPDGTTAGTTSDTIPGSGRVFYFPLSGVTSGFNGSAVVSSDQQVAAVVNVLGNNGVAAASYIGFQAGGTTLNLPLLMKGNFGYNTWFKVQNTGSAATNITVNYSDGTSATANNVAPGASATFDQSTETHSLTVFAATVTASQPIAASVIEENSTTMFAYNGFTAGSTLPVAPLINANYFGYITGIEIQNGGGASTQVTMSFTPALAGTACTETHTIAPGQAKTFSLYAFSVTAPAGKAPDATDCAFGSTFQGSGKVTVNSGNQPLTVIVNQLNSTAGTGEAYSGFDPAAATSKVVMPIIMDRYFGYFTGFNIMNVGTTATDINCTFTGTSVTVAKTGLAPNAAFNVNTTTFDKPIADSYVGSGTCTASGGGKIVGVVNELNSSGGDQFLVYEGINTP